MEVVETVAALAVDPVVAVEAAKVVVAVVVHFLVPGVAAITGVVAAAAAAAAVTIEVAMAAAVTTEVVVAAVGIIVVAVAEVIFEVGAVEVTTGADAAAISVVVGEAEVVSGALDRRSSLVKMKCFGTLSPKSPPRVFC